MRLRSLLFVPGDRPERMAKAALSGADAIILDLEDSVAPAAKPRAREAVAAFLRRPRSCTVMVRVNALDSVHFADDLACVEQGQADAVVLPKAHGAASVITISERLLPETPILPITAETPQAMFSLGDLVGAGRRLCGLTWGAEDLASAVGAAGPRLEGGGLAPPFEIARALTLFAAHAAEAPAIETVYADFRDLDGLGACAARARCDGFSGMLAIHPAQVPVINAAFTPTPEDLEAAQAVIDAFAANSTLGALSLTGRMIDRPHLVRARRTLLQAGQDSAV
jgi:citrate lyase subunit beta/citryl-CoA lyase